MESTNIGYLLHYVSSLLDRHSDQVLVERYGIGFSQFKVLTVLLESEGQAQNRLAEKLGQTEASVSRQVKIMKEKGLITTEQAKNNKRSKHIFLTNKGALLTKKSLQTLNDYHSPMFESLSEKERVNLLKTLIDLKNYL